MTPIADEGEAKAGRAGARAAPASAAAHALPAKRFARDERGGTALEYCFIAFLISIIAISAMTQIGVQTQANTQSVLRGFSR